MPRTVMSTLIYYRDPLQINPKKTNNFLKKRCFCRTLSRILTDISGTAIKTNKNDILKIKSSTSFEFVERPLPKKIKMRKKADEVLFRLIFSLYNWPPSLHTSQSNAHIFGLDLFVIVCAIYGYKAPNHPSQT